MSKIKIKEVCDRKILSEGRTSGMGFGFLKKGRGYNFKTIQPISPCKDYLAEVVFTEYSGKGTQGCGLKYPKKLDLENKGFFYMAIQIMKNQYNGSYHSHSTYDSDLKNLKKNYTNVQSFINKVEDILQFTDKTTISEANDDYFLIKVPNKWCKSTIMISMYTLLIRCAQVYDGEQDIYDFMEKLSSNIKNIDGPLLKQALPNIKDILEHKEIVEQPKEHLESLEKSSWWSPHGYGICSYKIKKEEPKSVLA